VVERKARTGRHPKTGEPIEIPASRTVKFKPVEKLKEVLT
jgi:nucleoid DNA-binding protein